MAGDDQRNPVIADTDALIADAEHAAASAGLLGATTADAIDGGFSDEAVETWMEAAVDPIEDRSDHATDRTDSVA